MARLRSRRKRSPVSHDAGNRTESDSEDTAPEAVSLEKGKQDALKQQKLEALARPKRKRQRKRTQTIETNVAASEEAEVGNAVSSEFTDEKEHEGTLALDVIQAAVEQEEANRLADADRERERAKIERRRKKRRRVAEAEKHFDELGILVTTLDNAETRGAIAPARDPLAFLEQRRSKATRKPLTLRDLGVTKPSRKTHAVRHRRRQTRRGEESPLARSGLFAVR